MRSTLFLWEEWAAFLLREKGSTSAYKSARVRKHAARPHPGGSPPPPRWRAAAWRRARAGRGGFASGEAKPRSYPVPRRRGGG